MCLVVIIKVDGFRIAATLYRKSCSGYNTKLNRFLKSPMFVDFIKDKPRQHVFTHNSHSHMFGLEEKHLVNEHLNDL